LNSTSKGYSVIIPNSMDELAVVRVFETIGIGSQLLLVEAMRDAGGTPGTYVQRTPSPQKGLRITLLVPQWPYSVGVIGRTPSGAVTARRCKWPLSCEKLPIRQSGSSLNRRRCESPGDTARIPALWPDQAPTAMIKCPRMTIPGRSYAD
jgi:hypothetical protein